jgi:hypothetical protein
MTRIKLCPVCRGYGCPPDRCLAQLDLPLLKPAANLFEFRDIQKFVAACRKAWPGAKITLRPNSEFVREHDAEPIGFVVGMPDNRSLDHGTGLEPTGDNECCSD